jgi:very-short-patch-repair endonuclease
MLSHGTAAWWLGLTNRVPPVIHVSTPRRAVSPPGVLVHGRRTLERTWHRALPIPSLPEVLLDYASTHSEDDIRYVLAQAEYHGYLQLEDVRLRQGKPGSAKLREALKRHQPQLAHTRSEFERRMLYLCEDHGIPIPTFNKWLHGHLVDAVWPEQRVVVECDGEDAHSRWAQIQSDHDRDLTLRAAGFTVLRYTWPQLTQRPDQVAADITRALSPTAPSAARGSR